MPYGVEVLSTLLSKSESLGSSPSGATMKYYIAYKDRFGKDFHGTPWIQPEGGIDNLNDAKKIKYKMRFQHCTNLILFGCDEELQETVTWTYVDEHKISD